MNLIRSWISDTVIPICNAAIERVHLHSLVLEWIFGTYERPNGHGFFFPYWFPSVWWTLKSGSVMTLEIFSNANHGVSGNRPQGNETNRQIMRHSFCSWNSPTRESNYILILIKFKDHLPCMQIIERVSTTESWLALETCFKRVMGGKASWRKW